MMGNRFQSLHLPIDSDGDFPITSVQNQNHTLNYTDTQNIDMIVSVSPICKLY